MAGGTGYALHHFSMSIEQGKIHALLGPNGAGKTTLMKIITGVLRGYSGEVFVLGNKMPDNKALISIGCAPQAISLYMSLTALENLHFFGVMANLSEAQIAARSDAVLAQTGLTDHAQKIVSTYSGGMQRRLNLAVALLHSPKLLLLDEPTVGVDPQTRNHIYETLSHLHASGMTILLSTHMMEEAARLCSSVTLLDKGEIIFDGPMSAIDNLEKFFLEKTGRGLRDD
ncbi:MAG TPA: ABC transporter ATP-binding protein [Smithella sp.]|nr:ABC transporter ATP-binding protein [Smithella sp.]HNY50317.1 ABC transporter ATP-binding protein [Smithella sp.]HOG91577.1 ABC transporter ATP-binding protein [Smithella sp.]HOU51783.1 ABC transporter ATP-binding protein [Smithella sp.]HQG66358.1 ABC transporter ATP-binding protein [Smithella sp.]